MNRRKFIGNIGLGVGATMLPISLLGNDKPPKKALISDGTTFVKRDTIVLLNDEHRRFFMMEPDETGKIKLNDLYWAVKETWKNDDEMIKYPFPLLGITPEMYETINGWYIVNPDMLYGGSIEDTTKGVFYQSLIVLGDFDNKWEVDGEIIHQTAILKDINNKEVFLLDKNNKKYSIHEMNSSAHWTIANNNRIYGNWYFPPV